MLLSPLTPVYRIKLVNKFSGFAEPIDSSPYSQKNATTSPYSSFISHGNHFPEELSLEAFIYIEDACYRIGPKLGRLW
jgi:hypothetical protein